MCLQWSQRRYTDSCQFESTSRPLPDTPASFLTDPSPAFSASPFLSPISFPSRLSINPDSSFHTMTGSKGSKSSWKRGVEKIFRSRSSAVLREAFNGQENQPSIHQPQTTPQQAQKPFGKHFSSSTPPMPFDESHRENVFSYHASGHLSSPPTAKSESFHRYSHPSLPHDPFASSLNLSSNQLSTTLTLIDSPKLGPPSSSRPRLSRNSPSLRDLKNLLPRPSKPSLSKAKSMANIREGEVPATPPADKTDYFSSYTLAKRMSSVIGLSHGARSDPNEEILSPAPMTIRPAPVTRPQFMRMPTESPPLLPPNPPYFPTSSSMSLRSPSLSSNLSSSVSSSGTSSTPGSRISSTQTLNTTLVLSSSMLTLAPTAPLPPSPGASTHPKPAVMAMQRSASGAVLLPRSRSTSMSLKAPPTSSSFYDLYEQLGIWPTPEKDKALADKALSGVGKDSEDDAPPSTKEDQDTTDASIQAQFQVSTSTSFSTTSWEATIGAFPMVNHLLTSTLDFGEPVVGDADIVETLDQYPSNDDAASDVLGDSAVRTSSSGTTQQQQTVRRAPSTTGKHGDAAVTSTSAPTGRTGSYGISREASGSGGSSRNSSRNRRPRDDDHRRAREEGGWFGGMPSGSSSESDEHDDRDDVPLSKLHPQAAAARQNTQERRKQRRADKLREKVRGRMSKQKVAGRNPGGGCNWDGEGGVPPDILVRRLEKVMISRTNELPAQNCSTAPGGVLSQRIQSEQIPVHSRPHPTLRPQRSFTNHTTADKDIPGNGVQRSQTLTRPRSSGRSQRPSSTMPSLPFDSLQPSPTTLQRPTSPASYPAGSRAAVQQGDQPLQSRPGPSRQNSNATSSSHGHTRLAPVPAVTGTADVTRSNTNATQRSYLSRQRSRAMSSTASTHQPTGEDNTHVRSTTEPVASRERTAHLVNAFIGSMNGKRIILETFPETTLRDTLLATHQRGDLVKPASGMSWVVVEVFAELGCGTSGLQFPVKTDGWPERYVREYEPLQTVVRGWDQSAKFNCLVFRESNRAVPTLAKVRNFSNLPVEADKALQAIPSNPPFLGSYIQCETKKGKWSKRWLETRGGQVFLSKNDKVRVGSHS